MIFFFPRFWTSKLSLPFCLDKYSSALVNNIFQYLHLIHFWGQFFVLSQCIKWYKLFSVQNGSSATSSFPWYLGLFESSATQSPVSPAFCSLSRVTLSNADSHEIMQYNHEIILPHPGFFLSFSGGAFKPAFDGYLCVSVIDIANWRNLLILPFSWLHER